MASGDTDRIEVMEMSVSKKTDNSNAPSGSEEDGSAFFKLNHNLSYIITFNFYLDLSIRVIRQSGDLGQCSQIGFVVLFQIAIEYLFLTKMFRMM